MTPPRWVLDCRPAVALLIALQACAELPIPAEPEVPVEITLDVPSGLVLEDATWLRATVTDPEGNRILGAPLHWDIDDEPLQILANEGGSVRVLGRLTGVAEVHTSLRPHPFLVSDTVSASVHVGYDSVEVSFPGIDSVLHVASRGELRVPVRAVDNRGRALRAEEMAQVQVRPGTALLGRARAVGAYEGDYLVWDSVAPGEDTVTVSFADCLQPCVDTLVVKVAFVPAGIGFPLEPFANFYFSSLGDSLRLTATLIDAAGFYVRDANPEYTFENPADSLVLDPAALAEGILVPRSDGDVRVHAQDGDIMGGLGVGIYQLPYQFEVLDPVARYLVGPGAEDMTRVQIQDERGNPMDSTREASLQFSVQDAGVAEPEILGEDLTAIRALDFGETLVWTRLIRWGCGELDCGSHEIVDTLRVIPEPDSVRALPPPVNPITTLGLVPDPLLGDIHLPGETLPATELVWTALDPTVAAVDRWGRITALSNGTARFEGRMGASADTVTLTVSAPGG